MSEGSFPRSVLVHGTGLIGSSLALALIKHLPVIRVYGIDSPEVFDHSTAGLWSLHRECRPHNFATPVGAILQSLDEVSSDPKSSWMSAAQAGYLRKAEARKLPFLRLIETGSDAPALKPPPRILFTGDLFFVLFRQRHRTRSRRSSLFSKQLARSPSSSILSNMTSLWPNSVISPRSSPLFWRTRRRLTRILRVPDGNP